VPFVTSHLAERGHLGPGRPPKGPEGRNSTWLGIPPERSGAGNVVREFLSDFKKFILRGNVLDLAVAVIVGAAFNAVVQSFANDVVMGCIGASAPDPSGLRGLLAPGDELVDEMGGHRVVMRVLDREPAAPAGHRAQVDRVAQHL